jgi:N-acetyl-1-D-myo-inositol-2-amino-2-deoxy-alpha-D-glucopyranoside deacetylase
MSDLRKVALKDKTQPVLLAVLAHPDDETFGTGGTLALYSRRGVQVYLVCATRGEVGEMDPSLLHGFDSVGDKREAELRCAAEKLGLAGVFFLGYRDSGMPGSPDNEHPLALAATPVDKVASEVAHYIQKLRPQVVLTFDPVGGYRHPDHIAIHKATVKAFKDLKDQVVRQDSQQFQIFSPQKLYYSTFSRTFLKVAVFMLRLFGRDPRHFGVNKDIDMVSIAAISFPIHARINYKAVAIIRDEAAACHASQGGGGMNRGIQGWVMRLFRSDETYMRAYPEPLPGERKETDLFAGI